jgi:hypothetical protein
MDKSISVYISTKDSDSEDCKKLQKIFESNIFDVNVIEFEENHKLSKLENELNQLKWVINDSKENQSVLFIKDYCDLSVNDVNMEVTMKNILEKTWDLCHLSIDPELVKQNNVINDFSAILLNEKSKEQIIKYDKNLLNDEKSFIKHLNKNNVKTICIYPNLFNSKSEIIYQLKDMNNKSEKKVKFEDLPPLPNVPLSADPEINNMLKSMYNQNTNNSLKLILILIIIIIIIVFIYWYYNKYMKY